MVQVLQRCWQFIPSSIPCSQDRSRRQDDHIQDHIHHTEGKGQPQPWGQPQPPSCRSSILCIPVRILCIPVHSIHHTEGRGQPQPWGQPQPHACRSSQDRIH